MKDNLFGFWIEYGWNKNSVSINNDIENYQQNFFDYPDSAIQFLELGIPIVGARMGINCVFTGEDIGTPIAFTDGTMIWSGEYLHYIREGILKLDSVFLSYMESVNFLVPDREVIGIEKLHKLQTDIK